MHSSSLMNRLLGAASAVLLAAGLCLATAPPAQAADQPALQAVDVQPLPGQQLQLTMRLSGPAPQPLSFTIDNPARISFDLPNTTLAMASKRIDVHASGLDTIVAAETKDGLVHRVSNGNHMGQAEGKITDITPSKISLIEIVPDSVGGYMERPAALALNE